jgi:predicted permease
MIAMLWSVRQDLLFALRQFRKNPGFVLAAVLTLALGIGASTAIFTLVNSILLQALAFPQSDRLVAVNPLEFPPGVAATNLAAATYIGVSYPDYFDWQRQNHTLASLASCDVVTRLFSKENGENARVIRGARVSDNFFSTFGVSPSLGRAFLPEEEQPGHRVAILSHELWVSDFAASPDVLGKIVRLSDEPSTIVGVMPKGFHYPVASTPALFYATYAADAEGTPPNTSLRDRSRIGAIGRLKPGVRVEQAQADLTAVQGQLAKQYPEDRYELAIRVTPLLEDSVDGVRQVLMLLMAAVGAVLTIGCANVAGLLLARASQRRPELALRTALGASRARILRQILLESLLLALGGGIAGILLSFILLQAGMGLLPADTPRLPDVAMDAKVLEFAILLSAITSLIFGLLPAWRMSRQDPMHAMREGAFTLTAGRHRNRLHHALVIGETALGFALLIGSGLLIRSMVNMLTIEPGFDIQHTVSFDIALSQKRFPDPTKVPFFAKVLPQLADLPGVESVSSGHPLPMYWSRGSWENFSIPGRPTSVGEEPGAIAAAVTPGYFKTLSIPLLRGRTFTEHDDAPQSARVAVINQSFARKYFPLEDPIGRMIVPDIEEPGQASMAREIVGIVGDTRSNVEEPYQPEFYLPYSQDPNHQRPLVVMKVTGDPYSYENAVRKIVAAVDKDTPVFRYRMFTDDIRNQAAQPRFEAILVSGFAVTALLLAAVGLYSVLSYIVAERTRELGLRMALGASRGNVLRLVLQRGLALGSTGIVVGAVSSVFATRLIADLLFKVKPLNGPIFVVVTLVLLAVSVLATLIPALRAAKVSPMEALRAE